jgi:HlyD family secretion protein
LDIRQNGDCAVGENQILRKLSLLLIPVLLVIGWAFLRRSAPPEVPFTRAITETLVSTLATNGKVEPVESASVRAEAPGTVEEVHVERGKVVVKGQLLVTLDASEAQSSLTSAQARIAQARSELETLSKGGRATEQAEIESGIARARADLAIAQREFEATRRLVEKKAATKAELDTAQEAVNRAALQIQAFERRRSSLVTAPDKAAAEARLHEAQAGAAAALRRIETAQIRSPMAGVVYHLEVKRGAYVNPGDLIAQVGRLDQLRVIVYVDEPELGRVAKGMPVTITWDAIPGREWTGTVEDVPLQVVPLGTRQVGEVICTIANPDMSLIPGTNVNAEIRSSVVQNAITLPKEALRRQSEDTGVLKLQGDKIVWQEVKLGVSNVTRVQISQGISQGDAVALPVDQPLASGDEVRPVFP